MIKFPCPRLVVSHDVLALLEESYENMEDDNYWEFLDPSVYDSSRPCKIMGKEVFPVISEVHTILQPIKSSYHLFQHHLAASIRETVQPFLSYLSKSLRIHFNKIGACRWTRMMFIPQFNGIYCLCFRLKHEGMN